MNSAPWWNLDLLFVLLNFSLGVIIFGGFTFLLLKVGSIDRSLKEILKRLDNR